MRFFGKTNIDFLGPRKTWYLISGALIVIGMLSILFKGGLDYGLDFTGGTELVVEFQQPPDVSAVRSMMDGAGFPKSEIKTYGDPKKLLIRTQALAEGTTIGNRIRESLQKSFANLQPQVLEEQKIGAKVGAELRRGAYLAVLFSLIAMLIYVGFRFKFIFGVGAVVALFHDVLVVLGIISLVDGLTPYTNFEIDQNMIAAFLTLVGLSVNDTVVIFDRLRENQKIYKSTPLFELMNKGLNETLSRTIITSGTIFIVTVVLFLFGGEVNRGFAFALTIGIITGTYSSIYIASAIVLEFNNYKERKKVKPIKA
ncbi:MAG: protein translocase subunit SecF [Ignavibacteriales bacterium]|nr:protein translocase subunit SecF [Ignavibacteriales bacterium]